MGVFASGARACLRRGRTTPFANLEVCASRAVSTSLASSLAAASFPSYGIGAAEEEMR